MSESKVTPIRAPRDLLDAVDRRVGPRRRSQFFVEAARRELARLEQTDALRASAGAWDVPGHTDLPDTVEGMTQALQKLQGQAARKTP